MEEFLSEIFNGLLFCILLWIVRFFFARIVCHNFIAKKERFRLPGLSEMILDPKYILLWTTEHWTAWANRNRK